MAGKHTATVGALLVFVAALLYFLSYARYGLAYDEGYLLDAVKKIMEGQVIYRDFHHTYAPGRFYLIAWAFRLFGNDLMVERIIFAILESVKCLLAFVIARKLRAGAFAWLAPLLICLAPGPWHKVFFSTFGFLAIYAVLIMLEKNWKGALACGLIVGISGIFRQDAAAFALLGALGGLALARATHLLTWRDVLKRLGGMIGGTLVSVVPVLGYFLWQHALGAMIEKVTREGMLDNLTNRIPYPGILPTTKLDAMYIKVILGSKILFYLPFIVYALAVFVIIRTLVKKQDTILTAGIAVVATAAILAFNQSVWRSDVGHLLQTMQFVFLLFPIVAAQLNRWVEEIVRARVGRRSVTVLLFAILPFIVLSAIYGCYLATTSRRVAMRFVEEGISVGDIEYLGSIVVRFGNDTRLGLERVPIYLRRDEAAFFMAIKEFLDKHTLPGDYVLAVPQLQMLYFFYDRRNPTRYAHYRRALDPDEEERYIEDIRTHATKYIFLVEPYEGARIGATRQPFSQYAQRVRSWILANYEEVERIGPVRILRMKK